MCRPATDPRAVHAWQPRTNPAEIAHKPKKRCGKQSTDADSFGFTHTIIGAEKRAQPWQVRRPVFT